MFLSFGPPAIVVYRVGVGFVSFRRHRAISGPRCVFFEGGAACQVRRWSPRAGAEFVLGYRYQGAPRSVLCQLSQFCNDERGLTSELWYVGRTLYVQDFGGCLFQHGLWRVYFDFWEEVYRRGSLPLLTPSVWRKNCPDDVSGRVSGIIDGYNLFLVFCYGYDFYEGSGTAAAQHGLYQT